MNFIDGIAISNYRSFGPEIQKIGPCSKLNIIIGKNNCGKSNILRFLKEYYKDLLNYINRKRVFEFKDQDDIHIGLTQNNINLGAGVIINDEVKLENYFSSLNTRGFSIGQLNLLKDLFTKLGRNNYEMIWAIFQGQGENQIDSVTKNLIGEISQILRAEGAKYISEAFGGTIYNRGEENIVKILRKLSFENNELKQVSSISALREIKNNNNDNINLSEFNGGGLILELAKYQDPEHTERSKRETFDKIQGFLQEVTDAPSALINIPFSRNHILVDMTGNGNFLPLDSLGTGIHEVIMLAAACTLLEDQIICIEEPELHLHPLLQKKFIKYIDAQTRNQYFISTHSAHLLDTPGASIFHVRLINGSSFVSPAYKVQEKSFICDDLGYKPSDLFQTNCIIWVEGPSDRIYLKYWINAMDNSLQEGIHYSVMFYGGKLLSHLTSEDDSEITDFISLRKLNRKLSIVIDSDKKLSARSQINKTKKRIKDEMSKNNGFVWITKGREIENYLSSNILLDAIKSVHSNKIIYKLSGEGSYGCLTKFVDKTGAEHPIDKVKVAKEYINMENNQIIWELDLEEKINDLITFIHEANHDTT